MQSYVISSHSTLQDLAALPRWVAYSGAPKDGGGIDKAPLSPKTGRAASNDRPATWGTHAAAAARADALKRPGHKPGVGIELGLLGDGTALCGVDLDGCHADGLEPWAQAICDRFKTYGEVSPSGEGVKLFFRVKAEDLPTIRKAMGTGHRKSWKRGDHYGAELHLTNSYFTVTGRAYGKHGDAFRVVPLADVLWLINEAGPAFLRGEMGTAAGRDESGSGYGYRLLLDIFRAGSTEEEARADIARDNGPAGEWWSRTDDRQRVRAVTGAKAEADQEKAQIVADFDLCWTAEELERARSPEIPPEEEAEIDAMIGLPSRALPAVRDDFGTPMMQGDKPINNQHNATLYLGRNLDSILPDLRRNQMTHRDEWRDGEVTDAAVVLARTALERRGLKTIGKELVADAIQIVARYRQYHPIRDDLARLQHDGRPRLDSWLVRYAGVADTPYARAVGRKFLIQMVARIMKPGCKADHTLVLIGPQRAGKSSLCRLLAGAAYHTDTLPSISGGKDVMEHLQGVWVVELSELAPARKSEAEDLKAFLTSQVDRFRSPYGKRTEAFPRQCVFIGTTNDDEFLRDPTGGRRFWPVHVGQIDLDGLAADRDQLLAEATAAFLAGEPWWLDPAFEEAHARPMQEAARIRDSWSDDVAAWLDKPVRGDLDFDGPGEVRTEVTVSDVLSGALGMTSAQATMAVQKRAGDVLRGLGWVKMKTMGRIVWRRGQS